MLLAHEELPWSAAQLLLGSPGLSQPVVWLCRFPLGCVSPGCAVPPGPGTLLYLEMGPVCDRVTQGLCLCCPAQGPQRLPVHQVKVVNPTPSSLDFS